MLACSPASSERLADVWPLSEFEQAPEMFLLRFLIAHGGEEGGLPDNGIEPDTGIAASLACRSRRMGVIRRIALS